MYGMEQKFTEAFELDISLYNNYTGMINLL